MLKIVHAQDSPYSYLFLGIHGCSYGMVFYSAFFDLPVHGTSCRYAYVIYNTIDIHRQIFFYC